MARDMLGKTLVHLTEQGRMAGRIVETEAYIGPGDLASHARSGPKGRAALMWGEPGHAYVYLIYGMYYCFNAISDHVGTASAALVRAVVPQDAAEGRRASGPGLLCTALQIDRSCHGLDLTGDELFIESAPDLPDESVRMGARIGVAYAGEWALRPYRFWVADSPHVSRRLAGAPFDRSVLLEKPG